MLETVKTLALEIGLKFLMALLVMIVGLRIVSFIEKRMMIAKSWIKVDSTLQLFVRSATRMGLKLLVIITAIMVAGVPMTTFVALLGAAGLAIGLALQGSLSNLAGGVLIISLRPFKVGDYIDGAGHSGTITEIGLFYTHMTTVDNRVIIIPNATIANSSVTNYVFYPTRRLDLEFGVDYSSDINKVKAVLMDTIMKHPLVLKDPEPFVRLAAHSDSSLVFKTRIWVNTPDYWSLNFDLQEQVKLAFDANDIEIPYPHMVIQSKK